MKTKYFLAVKNLADLGLKAKPDNGGGLVHLFCSGEELRFYLVEKSFIINDKSYSLYLIDPKGDIEVGPKTFRALARKSLAQGVGKEKVLGPWAVAEFAKLPGADEVLYPKQYLLDGSYTLDKTKGMRVPHVMFGDDCFALAKIKYNPKVSEIVNDAFDKGKFLEDNVSIKGLEPREK